MVNVGIMGLGFIGRMHLSTLRAGKRANVVAVADRVPENLAGKGGTEGNIALEGDVSLDGVALYDSADALLADEQVEAVLIALPTDLHKEYALKAIACGKHILCEKPLARNAAECAEIVAALEGYERCFMVAQCIRFWPAYVKAREILEAGTYGALQSAHFARVSPKPGWSWQGWLMDETRSGGAMLDLHVHDVDFVQDVLGEPQRIEAAGVREGAEGVGQVTALYHYDNGVLVTIDGGWNYHPTFPFHMAFRMALAGASLDFDSRVDAALHVHEASGQEHQPELLPGDGYSREQEYFLDCIESGTPPSVATAESALRSVALVEREHDALKKGS